MTARDSRLAARLAAIADQFADVPAAVQLLKLQEEAGEAASAYIGLTSTNKRKGTYSDEAAVLGELADVIITAYVAMARYSPDPLALVDTRAGVVLARLGVTPEGRS